MVLWALRASAVIWWANFLLSTRWAQIPGSLHGPKRPWFVAALVAYTLAVWWRQPAVESQPRSSLLSARESAALAACGSGLLACAFLTWFPLHTWSMVPFLDDWVPRFQSTREFVHWANLGWLAGWQWDFLGGYHTSSDVTQSLGLLGYVPMTLLGDTVGFHVLHAVLFAAIPWLVARDLSLGGMDRPTRLIAAGSTALLAANYSYFLVRSGDTNSLAGAVLTLATIVAAHAARHGHRWAAPALVSALLAVAYSHAGSFMYAVCYLLLDAAVCRSWRAAVLALGAAGVAQVAALPMTWESWRYPALFHFNNLYLEPPAFINWPALARKIFYNVELLWMPNRWFNDYGGLALVLLPVTVTVAVVDRSRVRFHAIAAVLTVGLMRLNDPHFGYVFIRPIHMFVIFLAPVVALAVTRYARSRLGAWTLAATVALYVQIWWQPVPHVRSLRDFNAALVERVTTASGGLVLVENNPHRNTTSAPGGVTAPSRFGNHFESLLAWETGRRLYAGYWDGWQWNPWRGQMLGGGTWIGAAIGDVSPIAFHAELDRWGVLELFVWSPASTEYFRADPRYQSVWTDGVWTQFTRTGGDGRSVTVRAGEASLEQRSVGGARVHLARAREGDTVVVRTHFHPAWTARVGAAPVPLRDEGGQLAFDAPCDSCDVMLEYPRRIALWYLAVATWMVGMVVAARFSVLRTGSR